MTRSIDLRKPSPSATLVAHATEYAPVVERSRSEGNSFADSKTRRRIMNRRTHTQLMTIALVVAGASLLGACAEQPTMMVIKGAAAANDDCTVSQNPDVFRSQGVLDISLANGYLLSPAIENVAPASGSNGAASQMMQMNTRGGVFTGLDVEGNGIIVESAKVDFDVLADLPGVDLGGFDVPVGGALVPPNGGTAAVSVQVMNDFHVEQLRGVIAPGQSALVVVELKMKGITTSDTTVESNTLRYPISVCNGCLVPDSCDGLEVQGCLIPGQDTVFCPPVDEDTTDTTMMMTMP